MAVNSPVNSADKPDYERLLKALREQIEAEWFQSAWEEGSDMALEDVIRLAVD